MAHKKSEDPVEKPVVSEAVENEPVEAVENEPVEAVENEPVEAVENEPVEAVENEPVEAVEEGVQEIPSYALDVLKIFSNLESAYVSFKGAVFSVDTPELMRGDAVLYKNPFYKS